MNLNKNCVLSCFTQSFDEIWKQKIFSIIFTRLKENEIAFLSRYKLKDSIGANFSQEYEQIRTYQNIYYYYYRSKIDNKGLELLIDDEEFYLGNIILLINSNKNDILKYAISWEDELIFAGVEIFKMDSDGLYFYWYNPPNE